MTDVGIAIFIIWFVISGILLLTNRDLFSPAKMLHLFLLITFVGVFYANETVTIYLTYFVLLFASLFIGIYEAFSLKDVSMKFKTKNFLIFKSRQVNTLILLLWMATIIPLAAQIYMIMSFGGIFSYLVSMTLRVKEFGGWGPVITVIKFMFVINILYFVILVFSKSLTKKALFFFFIHTCLTVSIGLLSGSRGTLLGNFIAMMIIYNYWGKPISIKFALTSLIVMLGFATVLGELRSGGLNISDDKVELSQNDNGPTFEERAKTSTTLNAALVPIRLIYEQNVKEKQYGLTFVATITNFIPSVVWDDKPRTGGLVLTQDFTGDSWDGFSNLSTGILSEFMINFGLALGLILGVFSLILMFVFFNKVYLYTRNRRIKALEFKSIFSVISYVWFLRTVSGLLSGEVANSLIVLILQLVSLFIIMGILKVGYWTIELTNKHDLVSKN